MERQEFKEFANRALEDVVQLAERRLGHKLPRPPRFQWFGREPSEEADVAEQIVERLYEGPLAIRPCVDLGVAALDAAGRPLILGVVSGHEPRPFGTNWTGRRGPFVYFIGAPLLNRIALNSVPIGQLIAYEILCASDL